MLEQNGFTRNNKVSVYNFCPQCGLKLVSKHIDNRLRLTCPDAKCGFVFWNNPIPVVAGIIEFNGDIVLARNESWDSDAYGLIAGYIEERETPQQAIERECLEELGLKAVSSEFFGCYPYPEENQIILVYYVKGDGVIKLGEELQSYQIFSLKSLKNWPFGMDKMQGWPFGCGWAIRDWLELRK